MMRGENHMMLVLFCLIVFSHFLPLVNSNPQLAPAFYVFGDSLLDSGNNNLLPTLARANFKPYGVDFPGGATGRFTNGRTVADFLAEFLGLPLSPPYLSFRRLETSTGLNYASSTCGILPETGTSAGKCLNLDEQIDLFEKTVREDLPKLFKNTEGLLEYLSKSIFLIATGSNDYSGNYLQPNSYSSRLYSPLSFAQLLTQSLSQKLERLYKLGARKVITFEIGPIGCQPSISRQYMHKYGQCVEEINNLVSLFNDQLATVLSKLTSTLPGSAFILGHDYGLTYDAIRNPSTYGLTDTSDPCCTTWLNGTSACIPEIAPCANPNEHFFWDGFHPTEAVYSVIASQCFNGDSVCIPTNLKMLTQI
ncbi:GDSL esterase/lipase 7-like [Camellia sinensis]|uniref:GDSL esterase/lipase 7-like n=1 Tax=Camellia sinensis TaxID=4442 RepID=UPI00103682DE|nr:GDSL esterase/lipase 7-like [Camellia sinensis]